MIDPDKDFNVTMHNVVGDESGDVEGEYPDLEEIDGILITGSSM